MSLGFIIKASISSPNFSCMPIRLAWLVEFAFTVWLHLPDGMYLAGNYLGKIDIADIYSSGYNLKI
ncbi:MAG: hypothetical protein CMP53_05850 [Flavobacteriales bacterium]|nr:hypothetical protein [Flavobacteriales bacterium]